MKRLIFIFLDGVGIGEPADTNPFYTARVKFLPFYQGNPGLPDGTPIKPIDACLGVEGTPQSASGQTSLYTGENIPKLMGMHKDSYPNRSMRKIIVEKNLLLELRKQGLNAVFINAYPVYTRFFSEEHFRIGPEGEMHFSGGFPSEFKRRISVTTCMMAAARQTPFSEKDIMAEQAIFQDFSNRWLIEKGLKLPEYSPEKAAEILYHAMRRHDFVLYEFFQTDLYGHRGSYSDQENLVKEIDRLLGALISLMDPQTDTLLLTADHGNLEDSTSRGHTRNPVPLVVWGNGANGLRDTIEAITDVTPAILKFFSYPFK